MVLMLQRSGERADATTLGDDVTVSHVRCVRSQRTSVNDVDNVRPSVDTGRMAEPTTGESLIALKKRSGLSLTAIAKGGGYRGRSSVQSFFSPTYDKPLDTEVAQRLADALEGRGHPPISRHDVFRLTGMPELAGGSPASNATAVKFEGASLVAVRDDLPVYGTALGAETVIDGEAIEQTTLNQAEVIEYRKRPPISNGVERVYGLYVQGSSMYPAHRDGAFLFAQWDAPLRVDDDVVVYLRPQDAGDDGQTARAVLVKRLRRRTAQYVELEQFNPALIFRIDMKDVIRIDKVLTTDDYA